jgi:hypothetical protein
MSNSIPISLSVGALGEVKRDSPRSDSPGRQGFLSAALFSVGVGSPRAPSSAGSPRTPTRKSSVAPEKPPTFLSPDNERHQQIAMRIFFSVLLRTQDIPHLKGHIVELLDNRAYDNMFMKSFLSAVQEYERKLSISFERLAQARE